MEFFNLFLILCAFYAALNRLCSEPLLRTLSFAELASFHCRALNRLIIQGVWEKQGTIFPGNSGASVTRLTTSFNTLHHGHHSVRWASVTRNKGERRSTPTNIQIIYAPAQPIRAKCACRRALCKTQSIKGKLKVSNKNQHTVGSWPHS